MSVEHARAGRRAGFTLVDALIVTAVAAILLGAAVVHGVVRPGSGAAIVRSNLFCRVDRALREIAADFERARFDAPGAAGDALSYQLPLEPLEGAAPDAARGEIEWGIVANGVPMRGGKATLRFVEDGVVEEKSLSVDLNGDGDQRDRFEQGHLERLLPDGGIEQLTGAWLLQPAGDHGADVDGDGRLDPLFALDSTDTTTIARLALVVAVPVGDGSFLVERIDRSFLCPNDRR